MKALVNDGARDVGSSEVADAKVEHPASDPDAGAAGLGRR